MYHLAVTTRLLTTLSVLQASHVQAPDWLWEAASRACGYVRYLCPPDERIPLLNDSVFDETERLDTVLQYARELNIDASLSSAPGDSGLYWLRGDEISVLFNAGNSGPSRQLAHTHNHPCTVLAWRGNARLITDTGTFDYQPGEKRQIARSVRSHNTVQVDATEPVSFGSRFRMSGAVQTMTAQASTEAVSAVTATYQTEKKQKYNHRRTCYDGPNWALVLDETDTVASSVISRLHAHPDVSVEGEQPFQFIHKEGPQLAVRPLGVETASVESAPYFPRFGEEIDRKVLTLHGKKPTFGYLLTQDSTEGSVTPMEAKPTNLHVDGERYRLPEIQL